MTATGRIRHIGDLARNDRCALGSTHNDLYGCIYGWIRVDSNYVRSDINQGPTAVPRRSRGAGMKKVAYSEIEVYDRGTSPRRALRRASRAVRALPGAEQKRRAEVSLTSPYARHMLTTMWSENMQ